MSYNYLFKKDNSNIFNLNFTAPLDAAQCMVNLANISPKQQH